MSSTTRDQSIVYQNQSHLAFEIVKYNKQFEEKDPRRIVPKEVVRLAKLLTLVALNPEVEKELSK